MSKDTVGTRFSGESRVALLPVCKATWKQVRRALDMSRKPEETEISRKIMELTGSRIFGADGNYVCTDNDIAQYLRNLGVTFLPGRYCLPL